MAKAEVERFETAFERLFPRAVRIAIRIVGQEATAEDMAAEALARAHLRWTRLGRQPHRDAWVLKTVTNLAIDYARRRRRQPQLSVDAAPSVEEQMILRLTVIDALQGLARRQREAIVLRYLCGLSERETADAMNVAVGTVKAAVHQGMKSLRLRMVPEEDLNEPRNPL